MGTLEKGYGLILANALHRILLSSLPGAAITSVRIEGVYHEFSTLPHVKEDVTEIILNVKKLRLRSFSDRPVRLQLSAVGPGRVQASDIALPSTIELINADQVLATLDSADGSPEMAAAEALEPGKIAIPPHVAEMPIEDLNLTVRTYNCLKRSGITKVGQILQMDRKELLGVRNFGQKSYDELQEALASRGLT